MNIAFCIRQEYDTQIGGDSIQLLKTKEYLEKNHGVSIQIITDAEALHQGFDLVHIFNLATRQETAAFFTKAKELQLKTALSTIFWNYAYQATKDLASLINYNIFAVPGTMKLFLGVDELFSKVLEKPRVIASPFKQFIRHCVAQADLLLPNSGEELEELALFSGLPAKSLWTKTKVVYNATDVAPDTLKATKSSIASYNVPEHYILQVGRIEYIKNQLGTLMALTDHPEIPIVFVGRSNDKKYYKLLQEKADKRGNVFFIEQVPHSDIYQFFQHAKLHVLPSLRESPGLVNLEALMNHCPIVVSDKRFLPFDTYFKGIATPVDPLSVESIRKGIFAELNTYRDFNSISNYIRQEFSWAHAAAQTFEGYRSIIAYKSNGSL